MCAMCNSAALGCNGVPFWLHSFCFGNLGFDNRAAVPADEVRMVALARLLGRGHLREA